MVGSEVSSPRPSFFICEVGTITPASQSCGRHRVLDVKASVACDGCRV